MLGLVTLALEYAYANGIIMVLAYVHALVFSQSHRLSKFRGQHYSIKIGWVLRLLEEHYPEFKRQRRMEREDPGMYLPIVWITPMLPSASHFD